MFYQFIQKLRKKNNFSQEYMANKLGISRPTYIQIEKGDKVIDINEAEKLASIFNIPLTKFINQEDPNDPVETKKQIIQDKKSGHKISIPEKNIPKLKEVLLYILVKVGNKPNVAQSVINKLFYFIDFDYYEKYEEQLIGATYIRNHFGPTPCELISVIKEMKKNKEIEEIQSQYYKFDQKKYLPLRQPKLELLSAREVSLIDNVLNRLSDKTAKEISEYSHGDIPWSVHKDGEEIDYGVVFYRDEKYSQRQYDEL